MEKRIKSATPMPITASRLKERGISLETTTETKTATETDVQKDVSTK